MTERTKPLSSSSAFSRVSCESAERFMSDLTFRYPSQAYYSDASQCAVDVEFKLFTTTRPSCSLWTKEFVLV